MRRFIISFILCPCVLHGFGQTKPMFSQYMYNMLTLNPSYAGIRNSTNVTGIFRDQWIGVDGAPKTFVASIDTKVRNKNWGLGLEFYDDEIGYEQSTGIQAHTSLHIPLSYENDGTTLSVGVGFGVMNYRGDFTKANAKFDSTR